MSEINQTSEILCNIKSFAGNLNKLKDMDSFSQNSEAIKTLNALIEKCKTCRKHIKQKSGGPGGPEDIYYIDSDINFDSDFNTNFDINKVLPVMEQIWDQYGEKLSHIMIYKTFGILGLALMSNSAESISTEQIERIFKLGENVLKSKIKFTESPIITICSISDVFGKLVVIIENGDFQDLDVLKIFEMLCDISFDSVDKINDVEVINTKNYFAAWALGSFVLTSFNFRLRKKDKCRKTEIKNDVMKYVWERAKEALKNGITERNTGITGGMFIVLEEMLEDMLKDQDIVDKDIVNVKVINDDFSGVLKLVGDVLKSEYSDNHPIRMAMKILWDIKLSKITKEQNTQVDTVLSDLGLWFENGEIVIKDKNTFDKLPKASCVKSEMRTVKNWVSRYTEEVRNGSKNTEVYKSGNGNNLNNENEVEKKIIKDKKLDNIDLDDNPKINVKQKEKRTTKKEIEMIEGLDNKDKKFDNINPEVSKVTVTNGNPKIEGKDINTEEANNFQTETKSEEDQNIELDNTNSGKRIINNNPEVIESNTQKEEADNKITYTNDRILKEIENAYCQNRETDSNILPDELCGAIKSSERYYYYAAMLPSEKYDEIKKDLSLWKRFVVFCYCSILFRFYDPQKDDAYKQPALNKDKNKVFSERTSITEPTTTKDQTNDKTFDNSLQ